VSQGILTQTGGATSHAAVVARGMDKPCVVGCKEMQFGIGYVDFGGADGQCKEGTVISIDGATGRVWKGEVPVVGGELTGESRKLLDALLDKAGLFPQVAEPQANSTVALADWVFRTDDEISKLVDKLVQVTQDGGVVVLDITPPDGFGTKEDRMIWEIAGKAPEADSFGERVVHKVLHAPVIVKNCRVVGGSEDQRELFALKEFDVLPQAKTMQELFEATGPVGLDPDLVKVLAPQGSVQKFMKALADTGVFKGQVMTGSKPAAYAALEMMGD
jgi:hypothetical protein